VLGNFRRAGCSGLRVPWLRPTGWRPGRRGTGRRDRILSPALAPGARLRARAGGLSPAPQESVRRPQPACEVRRSLDQVDITNACVGYARPVRAARTAPRTRMPATSYHRLSGFCCGPAGQLRLSFGESHGEHRLDDHLRVWDRLAAGQQLLEAHSMSTSTPSRPVSGSAELTPSTGLADACSMRVVFRRSARCPADRSSICLRRRASCAACWRSPHESACEKRARRTIAIAQRAEDLFNESSSRGRVASPVDQHFSRIRASTRSQSQTMADSDR